MNIIVAENNFSAFIFYSKKKKDLHEVLIEEEPKLNILKKKKGALCVLDIGFNYFYKNLCSTLSLLV